MKFITNKISTNKSSDFTDFVKKLAASNPSLSKTASTEASVIKKANIANFGDKQATPFGKKNDDKAKDSKECEGEGEEKEVCETNIVKTEDKKKKEASTRKPVAKKADNSAVDAANKGVTHKVDECCGAPTSKSNDGSQGDKKATPKVEAKTEDKEEKKESSSRNLVRIANLDSKTKNEWKKYWKNIYPTEYVEAMFADK